VSEVKSKYARIGWSIEDITDVYDLTDEQAEEFLEKYENSIRDSMIDAGWEAIDVYMSFYVIEKTEEEKD
jgi:hypothetical protein